jgi:putative Ca2+/H+ antiporter (TMEM165/GDT1 family)
MDWKIFFLTFGTVFLAELGDKTQLATLMYSTQTTKPWMVFAGAALALVTTSVIAVVAGQVAARFLPVTLVKTLAGASFILIGAFILYSVFRGAAA